MSTLTHFLQEHSLTPLLNHQKIQYTSGFITQKVNVQKCGNQKTVFMDFARQPESLNPAKGLILYFLTC